MKKVCAIAAALAVGVTGMTAAAQNTVVFSDGPGSVGGGEFTAVTSDFGTFQTFCMEYNENLDIVGGTTYEFDIATTVKFNGLGEGNEDPLDSRSAFVYQRFRDGEIRNILGDQGLSDERVANAIQIALWDIEDEGIDFSFHADFANSQALIAAAQSAIDNGDWVGIGNVRVMNNWVMGQSGTTDGARQDTLIIVPLPTGAALAGVGLFGLSAARRRRS
ncbi:MAG: VPLPA-CTERM sorting domain-containing protein [Planctomycetota bacterium]|nr:VPLPA-CTERM sorting domain-containing protein [Planctomycetota bacterium]